MARHFLIITLLFYCSASAQSFHVAGRVTDHNGQPVPYASVFLTNTSFGTKTSDQGTFDFTVPAGKYDLIASSIGYETYAQAISADQASDLKIRLQPKAKELETVVIEPFEADGWARWGKFFLESFIGTSAEASQCTIKNSNVIRFRNARQDRTLTAIALEPLIIENKALGYTIEYQLETFQYDFKTNYLMFQGYPFFRPMTGNTARQRRWERHRQDSYFGSMMHFMRSLYLNHLIEEGYEVRRLQRVPNLEKERVRLVYAENQIRRKRSDGTIEVSIKNNDTALYYDRILAQADFKRIIGKDILPGDSVAYAVNQTTAGLEFENYLLVIYTKKNAPLAYTQRFPKSSTAMMSEIELINGRPVEIQSSGRYYEPLDLFSSGYWSWSEKIANMLPFDYKEP